MASTNRKAGGTRDRMVETASKLLQTRGYAATSWRDLVDEAGTPWGSAHYHFPGGKEELAVAAVQFGSAHVARVLQECLDTSASVPAAVRHWFDLSARAMGASDYCGGCPVATVALETTPDLVDLSTACSESFRSWQCILTAALVGAGVARRRAAELAMLAVALLEGSLLLARTSRDVRPIRTAGRQIEQLLTAELLALAAHRATGNPRPG
jgi:TetR/AcrR family transcriptional repressor of lmrAB and yxaGH operons